MAPRKVNAEQPEAELSEREGSREHVFNRWLREHVAEFTESDHIRRLVTEGTDDAEEHEPTLAGVDHPLTMAWARKRRDTRPVASAARPAEGPELPMTVLGAGALRVSAQPTVTYDQRPPLAASASRLMNA